MFIADYENNRIRKVLKSGTISTVAGSGVTSFSGDGGPATSAGLFIPIALAIDAAGDLFIVDAGNQRVRMVLPNGIISTVAGNAGISPYPGDGFSAVDVPIFEPRGIAVDTSGNLFISAVLGKIFKVSGEIFCIHPAAT